MPTSEKKATTTPVTVGQLLSLFFNCDDPVQHADNMMHCWLSVLSNLDHETGSHMSPADIQLLSEFILEFRHMAGQGYLTAANAMA